MSPPSGFTRIAPPIPDWKYGQRLDETESGRQYLAGAEGGFQTYDPSPDNTLPIFSLLLTGVTPRPIAFISTRSEDGVDNLAPYSFFTIVSVDPPLLTFSAIYENAQIRDTARNVLTTKNFVVNISSAAWIHQANATSMDSPFGQSEWGFSGLTKQSSDLVSAPRVKECALAIECELYQHIPIKTKTGDPSAEVFYGIVRRIHLRKDMLLFSPHSRMPQVNSQRLNPVSRLGEISYGTLGHAFRMIKPKWKNEGEKALEESEESRKRSERMQKRVDYIQAKL